MPILAKTPQRQVLQFLSRPGAIIRERNTGCTGFSDQLLHTLAAMLKIVMIIIYRNPKYRNITEAKVFESK